MRLVTLLSSALLATAVSAGLGFGGKSIEIAPFDETLDGKQAIGLERTCV
jgi:hypothetical protein